MCLADNNKLGEAVYYWSAKRTTQDMPVIAGRFSAKKRHSYTCMHVLLHKADSKPPSQVSGGDGV